MLENFNKLAHVERTELAQIRKEEKKKAETERYMNEEDPVRARKLEVMEDSQSRIKLKKIIIMLIL